jgi:hypothetical protein
MTDENLELKLKLWNHLAQHGNLACSDAWYGTEKQAEGWAGISAAELDDPNSNASRELAQIDQLLEREDVKTGFNDSFCMMFDLGIGTGVKTVYLLQKMPGVLTYLTPYDGSLPLLRNAILNLLRSGVAVDFGDPICGIVNFVQDINSAQFQKAINELETYLKLPQLLEDIAKENIGFASEKFAPLFEEAIKKAYEKTKELKRELRELKKETTTLSRKDLQTRLYELRQNYNPELIQDLQGYLKELPRVVRYSDYASTIRITLDYIARTLVDAGLIQPYSGTLRSNKVMNRGLKADFSENNCEEIAFLRGNAEIVLHRAVNYILSRKIPPGKTIKAINDISDEFGLRDEYLDKYRHENTPIKGLFLLLGQTLGNFAPPEQKKLLCDLYYSMEPGDLLLLGIECRPSKDNPEYKRHVKELEKKYKNKTADDFLRSTTRLLNIPDEAIEFDASFKSNAVQMFYKVKAKDGILIPHPEDPDRQIYFARGKEILTATSYKFTPAEIKKLLKNAGFKLPYFPDRTDYIVALVQK